VLAVSSSGAGCASAPEMTRAQYFQLTPESAAHKAIETRQFETPISDELLSASAAVLQDLGFQITESDRDLGFLRAAKERSAREYSQEIWRFIVGLLSSFGSTAGNNMSDIPPVDLHQQINASLIACPIHGDETRQEVRIVFYRLVWKGSGQSNGVEISPGEQKMEMLRDPELYQQFYARLSKSVFLEAHKI